MFRKALIVLLVVSFLATACGVKGTLSFSGGVSFGADNTVTLHDGAEAVVVEKTTLTRDDVEIVLIPGQIIRAKGDVVINFTNSTIVGEYELVAPNTTPTVTATPELPTSTPVVTEIPVGTPTAQTTSWICYTPGAEDSLTYTQLMASNPMRVEHKVSDISLCPFGEGNNVFFHWTQIGASGDKLADTQGWFRQGDKENVINECKLQEGWCLVTND